MTRLPTLGSRGEGWVLLQVPVFAGVLGTALFLGPDWSGLPRIGGIVLGIALMAGGAILAVRGLADLREALTPLPAPKHGADLVDRGVYGHVRHPIYGGLILGAFGLGLAQASLASIIASAILAAFFWLKSTREEAWLTERYPGYAAYRRRTRRFIPWIG